MTRILAALALALVVPPPSPAMAAHLRQPRTVCAPVHVEGVGTVRVCGLPMRRR